MKIIADTHCHTIASAHAYSTVNENICQAQKKGLYAIAITDHCGGIPGAPGSWYFNNLRTIPREINGLKILRGVEVNVLNSDGETDMPLGLKEPLDWVIASMHDITYLGKRGVKECTNAWLEISKNPAINVIGHSGITGFEYDYEKVIPEFGKNGKLVEINNGSFYVRKGCENNCRRIAEICKENKVNVIVNSDSHFLTHIGEFDKALELLAEIDFPEELVVNSSVERFENYLKEHTKFFE